MERISVLPWPMTTAAAGTAVQTDAANSRVCLMLPTDSIARKISPPCRMRRFIIACICFTSQHFTKFWLDARHLSKLFSALFALLLARFHRYFCKTKEPKQSEISHQVCFSSLQLIRYLIPIEMLSILSFHNFTADMSFYQEMTKIRNARQKWQRRNAPIVGKERHLQIHYTNLSFGSQDKFSQTYENAAPQKNLDNLFSIW